MEAAKERLVSLVRTMRLEDALKEVGRSESSYNTWRRDDELFRARMDHSIRVKKNPGLRSPVPDFPEFCAKYLHQPLFWHQLQWFDMLEGREPRDLHPAQVYEQGDDQFLLINTPPEHGKSTTITMNYVTWRIVRDPNIRVMLVSASQNMAQKFLYGVKSRLTSPRFLALQQEFGPPEGWAATADSWSAKAIIVSGKDDGEKDPTCEAVGMGGQIYGARADLIIVDDAVLLSNAQQYDKQALWITQEVLTRLSSDGRMLVVGTRVAPMDLYKYLRSEFADEWSYLAQPAVLEQAGEPEQWRTLWPRTVDDDGNSVDKWTGPLLAKRKAKLLLGTWAMAYQQADVQEDAIFPEAAVKAAMNGQRMPCLMVPGARGHRERGMDGLYVICSMDPALSGSCASFVYAVDVQAGTRWVLDLHNEAGMTPASIRAHIKRWTETYQPREWRVEKNAMQGMLTQDDELRLWLSARGCRLVEHYTDAKKWDADYGVASMATLFLPALEGREPLIDLPANKAPGGNAAAAVDALAQQLVSWRPRPANGQRARPGTTDLVMALWFAEIRARELIVNRRSEVGFAPNPLLSRRDRARQVVVNIDEFLEQERRMASVV